MLKLKALYRTPSFYHFGPGTRRPSLKKSRLWPLSCPWPLSRHGPPATTGFCDQQLPAAKMRNRAEFCECQLPPQEWHHEGAPRGPTPLMGEVEPVVGSASTSYHSSAPSCHLRSNDRDSAYLLAPRTRRFTAPQLRMKHRAYEACRHRVRWVIWCHRLPLCILIEEALASSNNQHSSAVPRPTRAFLTRTSRSRWLQAPRRFENRPPCRYLLASPVSLRPSGATHSAAGPNRLGPHQPGNRPLCRCFCSPYPQRYAARRAQLIELLRVAPSRRLVPPMPTRAYHR